jgi:immunoglobulin heavy chain
MFACPAFKDVIQITLIRNCLCVSLDIMWISQPQQWQALIVWNNKFYSPLLKSQLTISKDTFNNQLFLTMTCMGPADTATHYCLRHHNGTATGASSTWTQAGPQCCPLLCASGKCEEVALSFL